MLMANCLISPRPTRMCLIRTEKPKSKARRMLHCCRASADAAGSGDQGKNSTRCRVWWMGDTDYRAAWGMQKALAEARGLGSAPDTLLLLEHPPTITLGVRGREANLLVPIEDLSREGVEVYRVDRGGDITFHGPGQLVGYPVLKLPARNRDLGLYLRKLEEVLIRTLACFGVRADRSPGHTGVWVGDRKIAAMGVKVDTRGVTQHGFALNVTTDLSNFEKIIPCGIRDKGVTSLALEARGNARMEEVVAEVAAAFGEVFDREMVWEPSHRACFPTSGPAGFEPLPAKRRQRQDGELRRR
jgi:lipoyl(octanoyl) transferase